jgi:integrase/recombinase XerD
MSTRRSLGSVTANADGLNVHLTEFLATLASSGYAQKTRHDKRRQIEPFIEWLRAERLAVADLDEALVAIYLARPTRGHCECSDRKGDAVHRFLQHLRGVGVVPPSRPSEPSPADVLVQRYLDHLHGERGLCARTIEVYSPFARAFVAAMRLPESVAFISPLTVRGYLLDRSRDRSVSFVKLLTAVLRSFLRFMFRDGGTDADLSTSVTPVRRWRLAEVPPFLTADEVEKVIAVTDRSTASGQRALAILLLLARLGMRAGEVVALQLDDIRWDVAEIVVRGKGRLHDRLPLLDDVGEALVVYLRDSRGPSASRKVFLRRIAPRVGLSGPCAISEIARQALRRAGLRPGGRVGAHIFRHSLATRMIWGGASLEEIAQVLRHRSPDTTQLYAKVEFAALRGVALPWPNAEVRP